MPRSKYIPTMRLVTRVQLAAELNTTQQVVDRLKNRGAIPYIKHGHFVRFDLDAVKAALRKHTINAA
jgi:hypothetical protein